MAELRNEKFAKGEVIFREGDQAAIPCMYDILIGAVGIYANYGKPNQKELVVLDPNRDVSFFGEMNLVEKAPRSATAVALSDCTLRVITEKDLNEYFKLRPLFVLQLMQQMSGRLRALTEDYMKACRLAAQPSEQSDEVKAPESEVECFVDAVRPQYTARKTIPEQNGEATETPELYELAAGTVVFKKGSIDHCMYELLSGEVGIYADHGLPTERKLTTLYPEKNRFFGGLSLIDCEPHSATAVTETKVVIRVIRSDALQSYFTKDPEMLLVLMRQISDRTRELTKDYMEVQKALAENSACEKVGAKKSSGLLAKLNFFANIGKKQNF